MNCLIFSDLTVWLFGYGSVTFHWPWNAVLEFSKLTPLLAITLYRIVNQCKGCINKYKMSRVFWLRDTYAYCLNKFLTCGRKLTFFTVIITRNSVKYRLSLNNKYSSSSEKWTRIDLIYIISCSWWPVCDVFYTLLYWFMAF